MGPFLIVTLQPFGTDLADLLQGFEHIGIEHFGPVRPIEALDKGILIRLPGLDVP